MTTSGWSGTAESSSPLWRPEGQSQGVVMALASLEAPGKTLPASASSRVWWLRRALWQHPCPFFTGLSSGDLSSASYKGTAIRFRSHPDTPGWSRPDILNLITSARTQFPLKVTDTVSGKKLRFVGLLLRLKLIISPWHYRIWESICNFYFL